MAKHIRLRSSSWRSGTFIKQLLLALMAVTAVAFFVAVFILFEFEKPVLVLEKEIRFLGGRVELPLRASDKRSGIKSITITLSQGDKTAKLLERTFPRQAWFTAAGPTSINEKVVIDAKKAGIKEGDAELMISVRDFSLMGLFQGNQAVQRIKVTMDTTPPKLTLSHAQRHIRPGGSGIAVYTISEKPGRHGVMIDSAFFPGFPTNKKDTFITYFALPWDAKNMGSTKVVVEDEAGNEVTASFPCSFKKADDKRDSVNLSDNFLQQKIPEFEQRFPQMQGSQLEKYLYVNNEVRQSNAQTIAKACANTDQKQLWSDRFIRMPGAGRAAYADQRSYIYNGRVVDNQTHLGVDIASTERIGIKAANRGKVIFADYLGIYGNMIILDHGQGISSLYAHLSSIDITMGTLVEKDQLIGHSGATGMAAGDHLHFSMLVQGIFVTPTEWWDQHWINVNIKTILNEK
jgi:murein DD-endopeptidase MepM/ murein hydrolase activator NlpD